MSTPTPPEGYRIVDPKKDAPKRADDLFWSGLCGKWDTVFNDGHFIDKDVYARKIEPEPPDLQARLRTAARYIGDSDTLSGIAKLLDEAADALTTSGDHAEEGGDAHAADRNPQADDRPSADATPAPSATEPMIVEKVRCNRDYFGGVIRIRSLDLQAREVFVCDRDPRHLEAQVRAEFEEIECPDCDGSGYNQFGGGKSGETEPCYSCGQTSHPGKLYRRREVKG